MSSASAMESANKALVKRWFEEVWNGGREELIDELRAPDAMAAGLGETGSESRGDVPFRTLYSNLRETFPDLRIQIHDMLADGDKVVVRITIEGTHIGSALGPAPTGQRVAFGGIIIARIEGGKIAQAWNSLDQLGLLRQIGALPAGSVRENFLTTRP